MTTKQRIKQILLFSRKTTKGKNVFSKTKSLSKKQKAILKAEMESGYFFNE